MNLITIHLHFPEISLQQEEAAVSLVSTKDGILTYLL